MGSVIPGRGTIFSPMLVAMVVFILSEGVFRGKL